MRKILLALPTLVLSAIVSAQNPDSVFIKRMADEILQNGKAYEHLRYLTKKIGARLSGSQGMVQSEKWGLKAMQETGADKAWLQECMVPHWVRGGTDKASYNLKGNNASAKLDVIALGNSIGTGTNGITGEVLLVNSFDELEAKKDQVKGKIVFYNYKFNPTFIRTFNAYSDAVKYRSQGPSRAAKYGATGVIVRSMSHSTDNHPHTGTTSYDSLYKKIPAVAVGLKDADILSEKIKTGQVTVKMYTYGHFLPDTIGHNVIGELTGIQFPNEIITVGGHLDSWDPAEGAHDDGAGCVQAIEILRAMKALGYKPKRTIRFVLFANEENGGRGGDKYMSEGKAKNEKHIFALESDAGGFTPRGFGITASDEVFTRIAKWKELFAPYGGGEITKGGGGSDISPLGRELGTVLAGLIPDSQRYFDVHHARNDVFENVNKRELELGAINMAALIYMVDQYGL